MFMSVCPERPASMERKPLALSKEARREKKRSPWNDDQSGCRGRRLCGSLFSILMYNQTGPTSDVSLLAPCTILPNWLYVNYAQR